MGEFKKEVEVVNRDLLSIKDYHKFMVIKIIKAIN